MVLGRRGGEVGGGLKNSNYDPSDAPREERKRGSWSDRKACGRVVMGRGEKKAVERNKKRLLAQGKNAKSGSPRWREL